MTWWEALLSTGLGFQHQGRESKHATSQGESQKLRRAASKQNIGQAASCRCSQQTTKNTILKLMQRHDQKVEGTGFENTLLHCAIERRVLRLQKHPDESQMLALVDIWRSSWPIYELTGSDTLTMRSWEFIDQEIEPPTIPCVAAFNNFRAAMSTSLEALLTDHVQSKKGASMLQHPLTWQTGYLMLKTMVLKAFLLIGLQSNNS